MKKLLCLFLTLCVLAVPAVAEITVEQNAKTIDDAAFAALYGAESASSDEQAGVTYSVKDGAIHKYSADNETDTTVYTLKEGAAYTNIRVGANGALYLLKRDLDDTAKAGILCLLPEGDGYTEFEYLFPGCCLNIELTGFDIDPTIENGYLLLTLRGESGDMPALAVFGSFWGVLDGYDCVVFQRDNTEYADMLEMETLFDVYGYINAEYDVLKESVASGALYTFESAALSPDGTMLLALTYGAKHAYVMELNSLRVERLALPEGFDGILRWSNQQIVAVPADGSAGFYPEFSAFADAPNAEDNMGGEWSTEGDWSNGGLDSEAALNGWNDVGDAETTGWN